MIPDMEITVKRVATTLCFLIINVRLALLMTPIVHRVVPLPIRVTNVVVVLEGCFPSGISA